VRMNILTELWLGYGLGEYSATRAWNPERTAAAMGALESAGLVDDGRLTDLGTAVRADVEARTDATQTGIVDALGADLDDVVTQLDRWSAMCIAAGTFPPDPRKRAAG
jgi:hypothetical protein